MIAITGSIGTGKTTVSNMIKALGFQVIDCDVLTHDMMKFDYEVINEIKTKFPSCFINNMMDRKTLGRIVFSDLEKKKELEHIIHPRIRKYLSNIKDKIDVFVEVPLLFESGMEDLFEAIICVYTDYDTQVKRVMERNNISKEEAIVRIKSQMTLDEKIQKSHFIIDNTKPLPDVLHQVKQVISKL